MSVAKCCKSLTESNNTSGFEFGGCIFESPLPIDNAATEEGYTPLLADLSQVTARARRTLLTGDIGKFYVFLVCCGKKGLEGVQMGYNQYRYKPMLRLTF